MHRYFIIVALSSFSYFGFGQATGLETINYPASPTAQSFMNFSGFSNPGASGKVPVTVPLFALQEGELAIDLSLNYNTGGIKVADISGVVGLGWSINIGGAITRTVRGVPDEAAGGYFTEGYKIDNFSGTDIDYSNYLSNVASNKVDAQPDIFNFSFPGGGGTFIFHYNGSVSTYPYQNILISGDPELGFEITTGQGVIYHFDVVEQTKKVGSSCGYSDTDDRVNEYNSAWYLSQIESPNCNSIYFTYSNSNYTFDWQPNEFADGYGIQRSICKNENTSDGKYVTNITSRKYSVDFIYSTDTRNDVSGAPRLDELKVKNKNTSTPISWYRFIYSETQNTAGSSYFNNYYNWGSTGYAYRLFLDGVDQVNTSDTETIPYRRFHYNSTLLPSRISTGQDRWGFYNGKNANNSYIEKTKVYFKNPSSVGDDQVREFGYADKSIDTTGNFTKAGILEKVVYPTGGFTEYEYEPNRFNSATADYSVKKHYKYKTYVCGEAYDCEERNETFGIIAGSPQNQVIDYFTVNKEQEVNLDYFITGDPSCSSSNFNIKVFNNNTNALKLVVYGELNDISNSSSISLVSGTYRVEIQVCDTEVTSGTNFYVASLSVNHIYNLGVLNTNEYTGGLRVKEIRNCTETDNCIIRQFEYEDQGGNSYGERLYSPNTLDYNVEHDCGIDPDMPEYVTTSRDWNQVFSYLDCSVLSEDSYFINEVKVHSGPQMYSWGNSHINYRKVRAIDINEAGIKNGYTEVTFTSPSDFMEIMFLSGNEYSKFDDLFFEVADTYPLLEIFKEHRQPSLPQSLPPAFTSYYFPGTLLPNIFPLIGKEKLRKTYTTNDILINEVENIYQLRLAGYHTFKSNNSSSNLTIPRGMNVIYHSGLVENGLPLGFYIVRYNLPTLWVELSESVEKKFDQNEQNQLLKSITYTYDSTYNLLKSSTYIDSNSKEIKEEIYYAFEYCPVVLPAIDSLVRSNRHATPIASVKYSDGKAVESRVGAYKLNDNKPVLDYSAKLITGSPISNFSQNVGTGGLIETFIPPYSFDQQTTFTEYSICAKPIEYKTADGVSQVILWDSDEVNVIGKATNATNDRVAFHSFDQGTQKSWLFNGASPINGGYTGNYAMNNSINSPPLPFGNYVISVWAKGTDGQVGVNGGNWKDVTNDWEYLEWSLTHLGGSISIDVNSAAVRFDEVKIYPQNATLEGYTYNDRYQIVAKSSSGRVCTHYQYDAFGRLSGAKDPDGNILNTYKYNFFNSTPIE